MHEAFPKNKLPHQYSASEAMQGKYWDSAAEWNNKANHLCLRDMSRAVLFNKLALSGLSEKVFLLLEKKKL